MTTIGFHPRDGSVSEHFADTTDDEVRVVLKQADAVADALAATPPTVRRSWLHAVAARIDAEAGALVELADDETALGQARLVGEVARVSSQLRFYGDVAAEGSYLGVTIDASSAEPSTLSRMSRPRGVVAVFGASNFPFAFGTLGNDTASALAAGCPVIVKSHPAHPRLAEGLSSLALDALAEVGAPGGVFQSVRGMPMGLALVQAEEVRAVAFTGSQRGGLALWEAANARARPIPVFAEMGTVNPVVMTAAAVGRADEIARGFVDSFTLGSGQFCTKPGMLFVPAGHGVPATIAAAFDGSTPRPMMLTKASADAVRSRLAEFDSAGASPLVQSGGDGPGWAAPAAVLTAPTEAIVEDSALLEECFGAVAIVVEYASSRELEGALSQLQPSLAASVFTGGESDPDAASMIKMLGRKSGRVTHDQWPTGVAWTWAQHHGGPWPATTTPEHTSVGARALDRFVTPLAFQSVPERWLPDWAAPALAPDNPWNLPRRIDGVLVAP